MLEHARALNLLQVIAKARIESIGRSSRIEKSWSGAKLVIGDPFMFLLLVLVLVLVSAME